MSKRFRIKVDNHSYSLRDRAVALKNKSLITVGSEHFYFFLPKHNFKMGLNEEEEEEEEDAKELGEIERENNLNEEDEDEDEE